MIIIEHSLPEIISVIGVPKIEDTDYRWNNYIIKEEVPEGTLLFNDLTKSFILLTKGEYSRPSDRISEFLIKNYYLVPMDFDEFETGNKLKKFKYDQKILNNQCSTQFTILPTTGCNARCFYCYEKGCNTRAMTEETAKKSAKFIADHCDKNVPVLLKWFGGEPTCNIKAMDIICNYLKDHKIAYNSEITSNGYLLNENNLDKIINLWRVINAQITLDGTEDVYNKSKNFIYKDTNAFQVVMDNIGTLISNGVYVIIRLNIGEHNYEDLLTLVEQIYDRFRRNRNLSVYVMPLFGEEDRKKREKMYEYAHLINLKLSEYGYLGMNIDRKYEDSQCGADCGRALQILPDGNIGLCEHFTDEDYVGHINKSQLDFKRISEWTERTDEQEGCRECPFYASCIKIKHCPEQSICYFEERDYKIKKFRLNMLNYFEMAKSAQYYQEQLMNQGGIQS